MDLDASHRPGADQLPRSLDHTPDREGRWANDKAPASSCNDCTLKASCTPHDENWHIDRSLAEFHETDVGRFHRRFSLMILAVAPAFSGVGLLARWNQPGESLLVVATAVSLVLLWLDERDAPEGSAHAAKSVLDFVYGRKISMI